jgi:hypothetical protein
LSIFMHAFYVRMRACPSCGRDPQDVVVSASAIADSNVGRLRDPGAAARRRRALRDRSVRAARHGADAAHVHRRVSRAREAWVRPLLGGSPTVLEIGANLLGFPHLYGFSAASLDRLAAAHGFTPAAHISGRHIPRRATASPRPHASKSNA